MKNLGITSKKAKENLAKYGPNEIKKIKKLNLTKLFFSQFTSPLILLLIGAALLSIFIEFLPGQQKDFIDAFLIIFIVIISGISGFIQEYKAEKSIEVLQKMSVPDIQVVRDGVVNRIPVVEITIDDIVLIEAGDIIPADGKILESFNLKVDESILTGESISVSKKENNEVFMSTSVYIGEATIQVTAIGMQTKIGKIAHKLQTIDNEKTTFEEEIRKLSKKIFWGTGLITIIIFFSNFLKYDLYTSLLTAVSLAVAAIPEGLPAVVVLSLALGAKTMLGNKALIRRLNVVESVGAVDIICSDKTGTITQNEMTGVRLYIDETNINIESGQIKAKDKKVAKELLQCSVICNNTKVKGHPDGKHQYLGEQTEVGLIKTAEKFDIHKEKLDKKFAKINEIPFSSDRKMMSVIVKDKEDKIKLYAKGAPEIIINKCDRILENGKTRKITNEDKENILKQNENFASNAYRVLGFAYKETTKNSTNEEKMIWLGLEAMTDPPHPEIKNMLTDCKTAGIRVVMITGDNPMTAQAVASSIGLESTGALEGKEIDKLNPAELEKAINGGINIFARTNPVHKMQILKILEKDNRVAMTGDGVNDSLAIKQADVGIAMGLKGTEVAKESSDMILMDDNFSTIVKAVKEGRRIFDNIRKFINYLLVSNIAEVLVIFLSAFIFTLDNPILLPAQILWINLLTDGMPALALGIDQARQDIMKEKPRHKNEPLINKKLAWLIGIMGIKKTIILLLTFYLVLPYGEEVARTTLFTGFILYEFVRVASIRYQEKLSWFSNPWLLMALIISLILQAFVIYSPLNSFFHATALGWDEWRILLSGIAVGFISAIIITKIINIKFSENN